jgi:hypothetical protein
MHVDQIDQVLIKKRPQREGGPILGALRATSGTATLPCLRQVCEPYPCRSHAPCMTWHRVQLASP